MKSVFFSPTDFSRMKGKGFSAESCSPRFECPELELQSRQLVIGVVEDMPPHALIIKLFNHEKIRGLMETNLICLDELDLDDPTSQIDEEEETERSRSPPLRRGGDTS